MKFGSGPVRFGSFRLWIGSDNNYKNQLISDKFVVLIQLRFGSGFFGQFWMIRGKNNLLGIFWI